MKAHPDQLSLKLEAGKPRITATRARELLSYDAETGVLTWKPGHQGVKAGSAAGTVWTNGRNSYRYLRIDDSRYLAHRLVYLIYYGAWPTAEIDHIDQDGLNNRISNLRAATRTINGRNQRKHSTNTSGVAGVHWQRAACKWQSYIRVDGKLVHLGYFDTLADAAHARKAAERRCNFHENHGMEQAA